MRNPNSHLVTAARQAMKHAHAPYSKFRVGAAILSRSGAIYTGCNVESSSYGLTICAERTAIFKAISEGERHFQAIAVVTDTAEPTPPCGACRQVLMDLAGDIDVIMACRRKGTAFVRLKELLPRAFGNKNLFKAKRKA
jgi:cytidine deaminase